MNNSEIKKLCLNIMRAQDSNEVVNILKSYELWDDKTNWRNYGDKEGSWGTINNQGNPAFALTEKLTNSVDAVLMNKCFESGKHPKSDDRDLPKKPLDAVHKYFENKDEIKKYDIDHTLFNENIDEVAGLQEFWDDKKARTVAENINISCGGDNGLYPNIAISDKGEGQTPEKLPQTIMSLHVGNKKSIKFAQGKWNQGGSGAILHSGQDTGIALQFVLTKRNPKIIKNFKEEKTELCDNWSFTILRRDKPQKPGEVSEAKYLCPIEDESNNKSLPLNFASDEMPIFAEKGVQFSKNSNHGTLIIMYEYKLARNNNSIRGDNSLYRQLDAQMPKLPLPIRIHETRKKFQGKAEQSLTMRGFSNFQENQFYKLKENSPLESISPRRGFIRCKNYKITYDIFCFKQNKGPTYIPGKAGLLWTVNGQTHAISNKNLFTSDKVGFNSIVNDLIIVIDCTSIEGADREDFFKSSRDRLNTDFHLYKEIRDSLAEDLSNHTSLQELQQKRIDESVKDDEITDQDTIEEIQKLLKDLPDDEKNFLPPGLQLKKAKIVQKDSGKFNLPKKKFPTFFCFEELKENPPKKQLIKRDVELNKTLSLRMFTDAETDYFERKISPGKMTVKWIYNEKEEVPESYNGPFLEQHGLCVLKRISLPKELKEGSEANLEIVVSDRENKDGYKLLVSVLIKPQQVKRKIKKNDKKKEKKQKENLPPEGGQGENTIEEIIENPIIAKYVTPEQWKEKTGKDVDEDDVLHIDKSRLGTKLNYNLFLNKTNINLLNEKKKISQKYSEKIIETKYKMGISLVAMFTLMQYRKDQRRGKLHLIDDATNPDENDDSESSKVVDDVLSIKVATRNAGKGIFMLSSYLESIGKNVVKNKVSDSEE